MTNNTTTNRRIATVKGWTHFAVTQQFDEATDWTDTLMGIPPDAEFQFSERVPDWEHDLNRAVGLIEDESGFIEIWRMGGEWHTSDGIGYDEKELAMLFCKRWLSVFEATKAGDK